MTFWVKFLSQNLVDKSWHLPVCLFNEQNAAGTIHAKKWLVHQATLGMRPQKILEFLWQDVALHRFFASVSDNYLKRRKELRGSLGNQILGRKQPN